MQLRNYQQNLVNSAVGADSHSLVCLPTGGGKTVCFGGIIESMPGSKFLILVHRTELVTQTINTLKRFGINAEAITSRGKYSINKGMVFVAMVETVYARRIIIPNIDVIITDECHILLHDKVYEFYPNARRIGFTATPITNKKLVYYQCESCHSIYKEKQICCFGEESSKWSRHVTLSELYNQIFIGPSIKELIKEGSLVKDLTFAYNYYSDVKDIEDKNEIAEESIKHDLSVLAEYKDKCEGKRTIIFTATTKQNPSLLKAFDGYNVRSYDSVNNDEHERKEIVDWFNSSKDAILINTTVFTVGFDSPEVEAIIINRPTKSLSLYIQMVGRGARPSNSIYKDHFILIDLGGNCARFLAFSDDRDWSNIFYNGTSKPKRLKAQLIECDSCGYNWLGSALEPCAECGNLNKAKVGEGRKFEADNTDRITTATNEIKMPNGPKVLEYCKRNGLGKAEYWNIVISRYVDLWKYHGDAQTFLNRVSNETLEPKIRAYIKQFYRLSVQLDGMNRTNNALAQKVIEKLRKLYGL